MSAEEHAWVTAAYELGKNSSATDLSGEWANDPSSRSLYERVTGLAYEDSDPYDVEAICDAWEQGANVRADAERQTSTFLGNPTAHAGLDAPTPDLGAGPVAGEMMRYADDS